MPTCENCQAIFKLSEQPVEITSTRVLCPACEREYRAEKAKRLAAKAAAANAGAGAAASPKPAAASAHAAAAPKPAPASAHTSAAPKPAAASAHASAPASARISAPATTATRPVPASLPPPVQNKPMPAKPVAPPARVEPQTAPAKNSHPAEAAPKAKAKPADAPPKKRSRDVERGTELIKQRSNRVLMVVWIIAGTLLAVAGTVVFFVKQKNDKEAAEIAAHVAMVKAFKAKFDTFDITREQDALALIGYAESNSAKWKHEDIEGDVSNRVAKAKTNVEVAHERGELFKQLEAIEAVVADPASDTRALTEARRNIDTLVPKAELVGTEFSARLGVARAKIAKAVAVGLHEEAKKAALDTGDPRGALGKYARAEEEIRPLMDEAYKSGNKDDLQYFTAQYKDVVKESDALCTTLFTPEVIEKTPWTDLLSGEQAGLWLASSNVSGFSHRIEKGVLQIVGPDAAAGGKKGVMSIGDRELWRDFVLEFDFTLEKGQVDMFVRLPKNTVPDSTIEVLTLATQGENAFVAGETYSCELSVIGSTEVYTVHSVEFKPEETVISWSKARKGSILFAIPGNTEIKISKMRIRELRN